MGRHAQDVEWWKVVAGAVIVMVTVREMFNDLFHPTQSGALSEWVGGRLFRLLKHWPSLLPTSGPLTIAVVIFAWALLLALGFALIYWAYFPGAYELPQTSRPGPHEGFSWSFYYSLEMMTTLGLGDLKPKPTWLKLLSAFHTLIGFSLVTASITWVVLVFPALRRIRTLARKAITLEDAERHTGVAVVSARMHLLIAGLAEEVIRARVDLVHFPLLFFFYSKDPRASLPHSLIPLLRFAEEGAQPERDPLVRLASEGLRLALHDLAELVGDRLGCKDRNPAAVFRRFVAVHSA